MNSIEVRELDYKRFNALAGHSRSPAAAYVSEELEWYANGEETILGVLLVDTVDADYVAILLARDEVGVFRCFDLETSIPTLDEARNWLVGAIKWHTGQGLTMHPQGEPEQGVDLFTPVVAPEKQHPYFIRLNSDEVFVPARAIINEMMAHFVDIDGNFVEQFQSTGFDSRLWELYLNTYLVEEQLFMDREYNAPDFMVTKYGETVAIEAVIVGRKRENPVRYFKSAPQLLDAEQIRELHRNEMPIRFGSPLYAKLQKEYWKLPHVAGKPLVFAIADFHDDQSMLWSSTALINYLYGVHHDFHYNENNQLVISPLQIDTHRVGGKEIPSGFFFQPNTENISAILFSASGTISKFNRMGRQAGFLHPDVTMIRMGTCHDHDPNACLPKMFRYVVDENCDETWAEGLSMFHNPNATHPVPKHLLPSIAHHEFKDGQIVSQLPDFHPYASTTIHLRAQRNA